jgi:hypothetical protein
MNCYNFKNRPTAHPLLGERAGVRGTAIFANQSRNRKGDTRSHLPTIHDEPQRPKNVHCNHESGRDDFHVVPFLKPEAWDDVEVVPTVHGDQAAVASPK